MVYRVLVKGKYWEERESYRDPVTGKPRTRFLRYLGKTLGVPQIDWHAAFHSEPCVAAAERAADEAEAKRGPEVEEVSRLPAGLHTGPREPVPLEKAPATAPAQTEATQSSQEAQPAEASEAGAPSGEPDASSEGEGS